MDKTYEQDDIVFICNDAYDGVSVEMKDGTLWCSYLRFNGNLRFNRMKGYTLSSPYEQEDISFIGEVITSNHQATSFIVVYMNDLTVWFSDYSYNQNIIMNIETKHQNEY